MNSNLFTSLERDQTDSIERRLLKERLLRKVKPKLPLNIHSKIFSIRCSPGKLWLTNWTNNIKYWDFNLSSCKAFGTIIETFKWISIQIKNTKKFTEKIRKQKTQKDHAIVLFNVVSLLTSVLLEETIKTMSRTLIFSTLKFFRKTNFSYFVRVRIGGKKC